PGDLDERRSTDDPVAPRKLVDELGVRLPAAPDPGEIRADVHAIERRRRAVGHQQDAPPGRRRHEAASLRTAELTVCSWTRSTSRLRRSVFVWGRTPWPRLKTWPWRPPASSRTRSAPVLVASQPARSRAE